MAGDGTNVGGLVAMVMTAEVVVVAVMTVMVVAVVWLWWSLQ